MDGRRRWLVFLTLGLIWFAPADAAAQVNNRLYIPYSVEGLRRLDHLTATDTGTVLGGDPSCVAPAPDGNGSYITIPSTNSIVRETLSGTSVLATGAAYQCLAVSADQQKLYVTTAANELLVMDAATGAVLATTVVGTAPFDVSISPDGSRVYVSSPGSDSIEVISTSTNAVITAIPLPDPRHLVISADGLTGWVLQPNSPTVWAVNLTNGLNSNGDLPNGNAVGIALHPDGTRVIVSESTGALWSVDADATPTAVFPGVITQANGPLGVTPDGNAIWAAHATNGFVRQYSLVDGSVVNTFAPNGFTATTTTAPILGATHVPNSYTVTADSDAALTTLGFKSAFVPILGGTLTLTDSFATNRGLSFPTNGRVDTGTHTVTFNGPVVGAGVLDKRGAGRLILNGPSTSDGTDVVAGTVEINGAHAGGVTVNASGALGGAGTVASAAIYGGMVRPGSLASTATLTVTGTADFSSNAVFAVRLDGAAAGTGYSKLAASSTTLTQAYLDVSVNFTPAPGTVFTIAENVSGTFTGTPEGAVVEDNGVRLIASYVGGDGNDFTLTVDGPPMLGAFSNQTPAPSSGPLMLPFTVSDDFSPAVVVTAVSSNQALVPNANLSVTGTGNSRQLVVQTVAGMTGLANITVTADDGYQTSQQVFSIAITDVAPVLAPIPNQEIAENGTLGPITLTVTDDWTSVADMVMTASSSNTALVANGSVTVLAGDPRTLIATPQNGASGQTTITVTATDALGNSVQQSFVLTVTAAPEPPPPPPATQTYYLAEGVTNAFFDTIVAIANPHGSTAPVVITFFKEDGETVVVNQTLAATSRTTIRVKEIEGLGAASFSTSVASTSGLSLAVERTTTWDAGGYGAHTEKASSGPASTWHFAEGAEGYFRTYFLLQNPHDAANVAHVTYLIEGGEPVQRDYPLQPSSRTTIEAAADEALMHRAFGATITFDLPGIAERAMYFGMTPVFSGGHGASGVTTPGTSWMLAEGATGSFFDTFILIANPGDAPAMVETTYLPLSGEPVTTSREIAPRSRATINIATEHASLASAAVATRVTSDVPVIVERSQYWPHGAWHEAHNSAGEQHAARRWALAEGRVGGPGHAQTYVLLANATDQAASVTVTFLREDGTPHVESVDVPARSRVNIAVAGADSDVPELAGESFGVSIVSTEPIVVERSIYWDANGVIWAAGTNATGTRLPDPQ